MATIQPRNPVFGLLRLLALGATLLSLLGLVVGVVAVVYAGAWGCIGHRIGWFGCTAATMVIPFASVFSLVVAGTLLFFFHLFYVAGAKVEEMQYRRRSVRDRARSLLFDVVTDILD